MENWLCRREGKIDTCCDCWEGVLLVLLWDGKLSLEAMKREAVAREEVGRGGRALGTTWRLNEQLIFLFVWSSLFVFGSLSIQFHGNE